MMWEVTKLIVGHLRQLATHVSVPTDKANANREKKAPEGVSFSEKLPNRKFLLMKL